MGFRRRQTRSTGALTLNFVERLQSASGARLRAWRLDSFLLDRSRFRRESKDGERIERECCAGNSPCARGRSPFWCASQTRPITTPPFLVAAANPPTSDPRAETFDKIHLIPTIDVRVGASVSIAIVLASLTMTPRKRHVTPSARTVGRSR